MPAAEFVEFSPTQTLVTFTVLILKDDPRGASYGKSWQPGEPPQTFDGVPLKLEPTEAYRMGLEETLYVWRILCDPPLLVDEKGRIRSSVTGELNITSAIEYPSEELAILIGTRNS